MRSFAAVDGKLLPELVSLAGYAIQRTDGSLTVLGSDERSILLDARFLPFAPAQHEPVAARGYGGKITLHLGRHFDFRMEAIRGELIAFFPQAWRSSTRGDDWYVAFQDVPWEEKSLVEYLMLNPWPKRRWQVRVYRSLRGRKAEN